MTVKTEDALDDIRRLILQRSREVDVTLADLSRRAGKNMSYMHQFIHRGSPSLLPEYVRLAIAPMLQLPEETLRPDWVLPQEIVPSPVKVVPTGYPRHSRTYVEQPREAEAQLIPIYTKEVDLSLVEEWAPLPHSLMHPNKLFAVWIRIDRGRCRSGDLVYFQTTQPPRVGDIVVVLKGNRITEIGDLLSMSETRATISVKADETGDFPMPEHRLMRAAFIRCA